MNTYLRNKILNHRDLSTGVYLDISLDVSISKTGRWINFNPLQMCFSIHDGRVNEAMSKVSMCIRYQNILKLMTNLKSISRDKVFDTGCTLNIPQYNYKSKKELILSFGRDKHSEKVIQLTIIDNTSQRGRASVNVDTEAFSTIVNVLQDFTGGLLKTDLSMKQLFTNCNVLEQLEELKNKSIIPQKITLGGEAEKHYTSDPKPEVKEEEDPQADEISDPNEYDEKPSEPSDTQQEFMNVCESSDMFSNVDIGISSKDLSKTPKDKLTKPDKPFIGTFLNYDLSKLEAWATSFVCLSEKSNSFSFSPFDIIMNLGKIDPKTRNGFIGEFGYYPMQYATMHILKTAVKNAIITGEYPKNVPAMKFNTTISKGTSLHKLSQEILVVFLMYSFINNSYLNTKNVSVMDLDGFKRSYLTVKLLFSPFIFSMENYDSLLEDLVRLFEVCVDGGLLKNIENKYTNIMCGGEINFDKEMFENYCKTFLDVISNSSTDKFSTDKETTETFERYNVPIPSMGIKCGEDIKKALFNIPLVKDDKDDIKIIDEPKVEAKQKIVDKKLDMFFECSKDYVDGKVLDSLKETCKSFDNLKKGFLKYDVPAELVKIKRAIEIDKEASTKQQILIIAKLFKEDESVTASSGFQENTFTDDATDIQNFLSNENIF